MILSAMLIALLPASADSATAEVADIYRDSFGVPHIDAPSQSSLAYSMGFALAEDRPFQLEVYRRAGEGRLSEILGPGEDEDHNGTGDYLEGDILMRQEFFDRTRLQEQIDAWDPQLRGLWESYAKGITAGWAEVIADPRRSPVEFAALGYQPEPWTVLDSVAVTLLFTIVDHGGYGGGGELENAVFLGQLRSRFQPDEADAVWNDILWINDPDASTVIPDADAPPPPANLTPPPATPPASQVDFLNLPLPLALSQSQDALMRRVRSEVALPKLGSYTVAVGPSQTSTGKAMLLGAPQSGIAAPPLVWEVGMHAPGIDCAGAAVPGAGPFLVNGTCSHHAWSIVAGSAADQVDVVIEKVSGDNYIYDGQPHPFERRVERFVVRDTNPTSATGPTFTTESREFLRSRHGTVFQVDSTNSVAYVRKRAQEGRVLDNLASLFHLTEAQTIDEVQFAIEEASWSVHIPYADKEGNIAYWFTGLNPVRASGLDLRLPTPGHSSEFEWAGFIPNPQVRNPAQDFIVANQGFESKPVGWWPSSDEWRIGRLERRSVTEDTLRRFIPSVDLADMERVNRLACCDIDPLVGFLADAMREAVALNPTPRRAAAIELLDSWQASGFAREDADGNGLYDASGLALWSMDDLQRDAYEGTLSPGPVWDGMYPLTFQDEIGGRPSIGGSQEQLGPLERFLRAARGLPTGLMPSRDYFDNRNTAPVETWDQLLVTALDSGISTLESRYGTTDMSSWKVPVNTISIRAIGALSVRDAKVMDHSSYNFISELGSCNALSILPPGQGAPVSSFDLLEYESDGSDPKQQASYPPHFIDQLEMYENWEFKPLRLCRADYLGDVVAKRSLVVAKTAANRPPNAVEDSATTRRERPISIDVLANDFDPDGDPVTITGFTVAANGSVTEDGDGSLTYEPDVGFSGKDSFTYTVTDPSGSNDTATVSIEIMPFPSVNIDDVSVQEGGGVASLTVSLSESTEDLVTVDFATANGTARAGSDFNATSGTLTFNAGDTTKTLDVQVLQDGVDEAAESCWINQSGVNNSTKVDPKGQITNNDHHTSPSLSIEDVTVNEGDGLATFVVTKSGPTEQTVTVDFVTVDDSANGGSDYSHSSGSLSFASDVATMAIKVPITDDGAVESTESFLMALSNPTNATLGTPQATATIIDNDEALPPPVEPGEPLGGVLMGSPDAASWGANRLDVFARGIDDQLYHRWWDGTAWHGWESLGGTVTSDPTAISWGPNRIDVFYKGADNGLWHRWWDGSSWKGPVALGGALVGGPDASSSASNRIDVFVRGIDNGLWQRRWDGTTWHPYQSLGGTVTSDPTAISSSRKRIDTLFRGSAGLLERRRWDGSTWGLSETVGDSLIGGPDAAISGKNRLDVFYRGTDNRLYHRLWDGLTWRPSIGLDGNLTSDPSAVSRASNRLDVFYRGTDNQLYHRWWDGTNWNP